MLPIRRLSQNTLTLLMLAALAGPALASPLYQLRIPVPGLRPATAPAPAPPTSSTVLALSPAVNGKTQWDLATDGPLVLSSYGAYQLKASSNDLAVHVKMWGAAGGGAMSSSTTCPSTYLGGAGGFAGGTLTLSQGTWYVAWVGQGGNHGTDPAAPFGQAGKAVTANNGYIAGSGGGLSGLFTASASQANALLVAGGGGGGGDNFGGGAGQAGVDTTASSGKPGGGATASAGGSAGVAGSDGVGYAGTAFQGASYLTNGGSGGGGGGGYFGGGSGGKNNYIGSSGGGGSNYASPLVASPQLVNGDTVTPGQASDPDRGNAGAPAPGYSSGGSTTKCSGRDGLVKIWY